MITFFIALAVLIVGYLIYGKIIEKLFGADSKRETPAITMADGVDYVPMKPWRIFLIQFLNIAGVGPIIGAIMGAQFGTASFLWIVLGSIFAGAVHDYLAGMISLRTKGASLPEIHGMYLGNGVKQFMRGFTVLLMILVGVVFVNTPATLLINNFTPGWNPYVWVIIILAYYLIATLLPIDKLRLVKDKRHEDGNRHAEQKYSENRIKSADELVDWQQSRNQIISQDDDNPNVRIPTWREVVD